MLTVQEKDRIALLCGYPSTVEMFKSEKLEEQVFDLNDTQMLFVRRSLDEIERLEGLIKNAVTHSKAIQVEEIKLNLSYRQSLIEAAALEVDRIAHVLQLPMLSNFYRQSENKFYFDSGVKNSPGSYHGGFTVR